MNTGFQTTASITIACALILGIGLPTAANAKKKSSPYEKLDVFSQTLSYIERHHVAILDDDELIFSAIKGMLRAIDPHSSFLTPAEYAILQEDTSGRFFGVGLEVGVRNDFLTVISPMENSPAEQAGLLPEDHIVRIEGSPTATMNLENAVQLMRGPAGTSITITVRRDGVPQPFDVVLTRAAISVRSVVAELVAPGIAHIRIRSFQDRTTEDLKKALSQMKLEGGPLQLLD